MENIICIQNVTKRFKDTTALRQISVTFEKGQIHGLIGRNGSGKTVLLKCLCGLMHPDEGSITVNGKIIDERYDIPDNIGAIIEAPGFLPNYSGYHNLLFLAGINRTIHREQIVQAMQTVGLDPYSKKHVSKYSLGMRQRLGLAQAIMEDPALLILDEPTNGLDKNAVEELRTLLLNFKKQGKTILLASHNMEDIGILCDTVHEMDAGSLSQIKIPSCSEYQKRQI